MARALRHKAAAGKPLDNQSRRPAANFPLPHCTLSRLGLADQARSRDGVAGSVSIRTPSGRNASSIALATAGGATMRPLPLKALNATSLNPTAVK